MLALRFASRDEVAALLCCEFRSARVEEALSRHHEDLVRLGIVGPNYWLYVGSAENPYERLMIHLSGVEGFLVSLVMIEPALEATKRLVHVAIASPADQTTNLQLARTGVFNSSRFHAT